VANLSLAIAARDRSLLGRTIEICRKQLEVTRDHGLSQSKLAAWALSALGEALVETNDVEEALARAEVAEKLLDRVQDVSAIGWCFRCLMRIQLSTGNLDGAENIGEMMSKRARASTMPPWVTSQLSVWTTRVWLARGDLEAAGRWMEERGSTTRIPDGAGYFAFLEYITAARTPMAQGRFADSADLLSRLLEIAGKSGHTASAIEMQALKALCLDAAGDAPRALESVGHAPAAFPVEVPDETQPVASSASESELLEPLSERELEVLALIGEGLSNQEVGTKLFISLHTVKAHTRNIYAKLGAHNRTEAVARARALGLLPLA
jgi:LuxR family maltose regulon positive regulatory protein